MMYKSLASIKKYTSHPTTLIFLSGFLFDMVMLPDLEDPIARYIGFGHLCIVAFFIMFREWVVSQNTASKTEQRIYKLSSFFISFSSGAALSFIFIYALRSAALAISWPLFVILFLCIIANEFALTHDFRFTLDIGVLFIATVFFNIFNTPFILKEQNDQTFGISILIAICISLVYIYFLKFSSEAARYETPRGYALALGIPMFVGMLYFLNIIPAVPLSLKESGVYHNLTRTDKGTFIGQGEIDTRTFAKFDTPIYHLTSSDTGVYFFSAVNAPAKLTAPLSHVWEFYDSNSKKWIQSTIVPFTISGGREDGYRSFSYKANIDEGLWRVTVKLDGNRVVGQMKFKVIKTDNRIETKQIFL